jgi:poly(hydroxyalkanoate) granule-associated protein
MVKKVQAKPVTASTTTPLPLPGAVKDSAQQIWQAGLASFTRAQAEGSKAFESLVKEGKDIQRKTQSTAEAKMAQAALKMSGMASDISSKASVQLSKLETMLEASVGKALKKLGVPSSQDLAELIARIDALAQAVHKLSPLQAGPGASVAKRNSPKAAVTPQRVAKKSPDAKAPARKARSKAATA